MRHVIVATVALASASGCGLTGMFEEPPDLGVQPVCEPEQVGTFGNSCGVCGTGTETRRCNAEGQWEAVSCDDQYDLDGDGWANEDCVDRAEGCCVAQIDCNDHDEDVRPESFECTWREAAAGTPDEETCTLDCGEPGARTCTAACEWSACDAPQDLCDGVDNDCDDSTDEDAGCERGASVECTAECGSTGTGLCTSACVAPTGADCVPPEETCSGEDDDCDDSTDEGFQCIRGETVSCQTTCGGERGSGRCTDGCGLPLPADCTPPSEVCNGRDDDCDGDPDDGFDCVQGLRVECSVLCLGVPRESHGDCTNSCAVPSTPAEGCPYPPEACNDGVDNDCDDQTDETDAGQCTPGTTVFCETDCDPPGSETGTGVCTDGCLPPEGADCRPPAEGCNGRDDDCDGSTDEGFPCAASLPTPCDSECGTTGTGICSADCTVPDAEHCDPPDEICNGEDDDCDDTPDDGFGCVAGELSGCFTDCESVGQSLCSDLCVAGPCVPPLESCNGQDDDCDDSTDEGYPCAAGSSLACSTTCDPVGVQTGTGSCTNECQLPTPATCVEPDESCNGRDDDCDGVCDDGWPCCIGDTVSCVTLCGGVGEGTCTSACEIPAPADCTPTEVCNSIDDDCDASTDEGYACAQGHTVACATGCDPPGSTTGTGTCTDACEVPPPVFCTEPAETCTGRDDDCDGLTDEGFECVKGAAGIACVTACGGAGIGTCTDACEIPEGVACTPTEVCNAIDDDCDAATDEGFDCVRGELAWCPTSCDPPGVETGTGLCSATCEFPDPADCVEPPETCDGRDNDCDTQIDEGFPCVAGGTVACTTACFTAGSGTCSMTCQIPTGAACVGTEVCNAADDDCDGSTDETFECVQNAVGIPCVSEGCPGTGNCSSDCHYLCVPAWPATTNVPRPIAPRNGLRNGSHLVADHLRPTFYWMPVPAMPCGATTYRLQVTDDCATPGFASCSFATPDIDAIDIPGASPLVSYRPAAPLAVSSTQPVGRRYYWRVAACDVYDRCGPWSAVRYVDIGREPNDFNGDGYADLAVGAYQNDAGGANSGRAYIYFGGAAFDTTADVTPTGASGSQLGVRAGGAGDINADGFADLLVARSSTIEVYLGAAGMDSTSDLTLAGTFTALFGSIAGIGDVNADGFADVFTGGGGPLCPGGVCTPGTLRVYLGGSPPDAVVDIENTAAASTNGNASAGIGDFNADGYADFITVAPSGPYECAAPCEEPPFTFLPTSRGEVFVHLGGTTIDLAIAAQIEGSVDGALLGRGVTGALDYNGDHFDDFVLYEGDAGQSHAYYGGIAADLATVDRTIIQAISGGIGSWPLAWADDADGDGYQDLVMGNNNDTTGGSGAGAGFVFRGAPTPPAAWAVRVVGAAASDNLGYAAAGVGDLNADGLSDVAFGAWMNDAGGSNAGRTTILWGRNPLDASAVTHIDGAAADDRFGRAIAAIPP